MSRLSRAPGRVRRKRRRARTKASKPRSTGSRSRCFRACSSASIRKRRRPFSKDELAEEFRPIIGEVLAELKINLNRREQFALEKVLVDELLGLGPLEELLSDPDISDIMVNGPNQTFIEKQRQARDRPDPVPRRGASVPDRPAHRQQGRPPRRPDHAARRRPSPGRLARQRHRPAALACAERPSRSVNSPRSRSPST